MNNPTIKILLADDDAAILDAMTLMLQIHNYSVVATPDGNKVVPALKEEPDLVILDTWMSGVDGRDVCKEIKSDPLTSHIPVLMISASHEIKPSAMNAGADEFIAKPFEMAEFLDLVEKMTTVAK